MLKVFLRLVVLAADCVFRPCCGAVMLPRVITLTVKLPDQIKCDPLSFVEHEQEKHRRQINDGSK